jgi:hypothetical protein
VQQRDNGVDLEGNEAINDVAENWGGGGGGRLRQRRRGDSHNGQRGGRVGNWRGRGNGRGGCSTTSAS